MDLHRFWDGVIISSSNLTRLRNEATALRNRQEFQRGQLTELASSDFESWAKENYEIATKIAYLTEGGSAFQKVEIRTVPMSKRLLCFLWATLSARDGLQIDG
jgi:hypothetical protein